MKPALVLFAALAVATPAVATDAPGSPWTRATARAFLAEHRARAGVVATRSGLQYRIVVAGTGCRPKKDSVVHVRYQVRLGDAPGVVDETSAPIALPLRDMVPAWKEGIPLMREGATWEFTAPPALADGEQGLPPRVPAHAPLVFRVELVKAPQCAAAAKE